MTARDIMNDAPICVGLQAPIEEVARILSDKNIGGVVVVDGTGAAVGMLTQTDLLHRVAHPHLPPHVDILGSVIYLCHPHKVEELLGKMAGVVAKDAMTRDLVSASPETPVENLADLMLENRIGRVPILEEGRPVGIVTRYDLIRKLALGS